MNSKTKLIPHPECEAKAKLEVTSVSHGAYRYAAKAINGRLETPAEFHWRGVRETMPRYFWNRIRQDQDGLCGWCNKPLEEVKNVAG